MDKENDPFIPLLVKAFSNPGSTLYFPVKEGLAFLSAIKDKVKFNIIKELFEIPKDDNFKPFDLHVYIEKDTLFMHIGDHMIHNFTFGLSDKELIRETLLLQDGFDFLLACRDKEGIHLARYQATFSDRHLEVIELFVNNKYSKEINLKDKFGKHAHEETEREAQLKLLKEVLNFTVVPQRDDVLEFISKRYDIDQVDTEDNSVMNEILDYVLTRFIINILPLGYCVHDKEELIV